MKLKMVQMKSQCETPHHLSDVGRVPSKSAAEEMGLPVISHSLEKTHSQTLDSWKKRIIKLQSQKQSLAKEVVDFKKKERKFDLRKKNLEDAMRRVNHLQRQLMRKEEETVECQLREKAARARLHEVQVALQKSKAKNFEPGKLIKLIPALRSWLRSLKKTAPVKSNQRELLQVEQFEAILGRILENVPQELLRKPGQLCLSRSATKQSQGQSHSLPVDCIREVYALQKELQRLAVNR
eukprot:c15334_g1_i1 orf=211-924(+)